MEVHVGSNEPLAKVHILKRGMSMARLAKVSPQALRKRILQASSWVTWTVFIVSSLETSVSATAYRALQSIAQMADYCTFLSSVLSSARYAGSYG